MPRGYFLSVEPVRAARHFHAIAPFVGTNEVRSVSAPGSRPGTYELLVVAGDRPGLLSSVAGALAVGDHRGAVAGVPLDAPSHPRGGDLARATCGGDAPALPTTQGADAGDRQG
jgi:hypothetical protein